MADNPDPYTLDGTNTWLIGGDGSAIVVDPGPDDTTHLDSIMKRVTDAGVTVDLIALTHGHIDHSALVDELHSKTGAPVAAARKELCVDHEPLTDDYVLSGGGSSIRVITTPGHTSDSVCFLVDSHELLTGDTLLGGSSTMIDYPDGNLGDYMASLATLERTVVESRVTVILPGHGRNLDEPLTAVRSYREHRQRRIDEVQSLVDQGVTDPEQITTLIYPSIGEYLAEGAFQNVSAALDYLGVTFNGNGSTARSPE